MDEPSAPMPTAEEMYADSVRRYGVEHTHDVECRTWRGYNWAGACDCTLPERDRMRLGR